MKRILRGPSRLTGRFALFAIILSLIQPVVGVTQHDDSATAAVASQFNPGNIISDALFFDSQSMNAADIQYFLNQRSGRCLVGYTCLKSYSQAVPNMPPQSGLCNGFTASNSMSAAQIIAGVAVSCGISPKTLLVLLEKEQSLVTSTSPSPSRYLHATGFACPDTAGCDPAFAGFFNQVYAAGRQLKNYGLNPNSFNFRAAQTANILYHPDRNCGSSSVYIQNRATAALYNYTPYQPDAEALGNLYGTGGGCSAYGNRNFWRLYTDWFGPTTAPPGTPEGDVALTLTTNGVRLSGWALDRDVLNSPISVAVQIGNSWKGTTANLLGRDLSGLVAGAGDRHDFGLDIPLSPGVYAVCVHLLNAAGPGGMGLLPCETINVPESPAPIGNLDTTEIKPGGVVLSGWVSRPDAPGSKTNVALSVNGNWQPASVGITPTSPAAIAASAPQKSGFIGEIKTGVGTHEVCVWASRTNGAAAKIDCRTIVVPQESPAQAQIESIVVSGNQVIVSGWSVWPSRPTTSVGIALNAGSTWVGGISNQPNSNAALSVPGAGSNHGFTSTITLAAGQHSVCLWTHNPLSTPTQAGCRVVYVGMSNPESIVQLEKVASTSSGISISGYALWPEQLSKNVRIAIQINGAWVPSDATTPNASAQLMYPGNPHGFDVNIGAPEGINRFCLWAAQPLSPPALIDCQTILVGPGEAGLVSNLTSVEGGIGGVHVEGWVAEPSAPDTPVHLAINIGRLWVPMDTADASEGAKLFYGASAANQGFSSFVPLNKGDHTVCIWASSSAGPRNLGCNVIRVYQSPEVSGFLRSATGIAGGIDLSGWAIWPAFPSVQVNVAANIGSQWFSIPRGVTDLSVPKWAAGAGPTLGFRGVMPAASGVQNVCIWASTRAGPAQLLTCSDVLVP